MKYKISCLAFTALWLLSIGCSSSQKNEAASASLKQIFKDDFLIGTALNTRQIEERDSTAGVLILQHFNAITPENIMKAEEIHISWDQYNFDLADKLVAYGNKYDIKINGHTLIWHSQLPAFMRRMKDADSVKQFFTSHINTVAARYDGKVFSWDVVNEALNEDGTMRKSVFLDKLGPDFVTEAFRLTQAAAPNTELYYTITITNNQRREPVVLH
jgi:endo-1,4-beta-xylanase